MSVWCFSRIDLTMLFQLSFSSNQAINRTTVSANHSALATTEPINQSSHQRGQMLQLLNQSINQWKDGKGRYFDNTGNKFPRHYISTFGIHWSFWIYLFRCYRYSCFKATGWNVEEADSREGRIRTTGRSSRVSLLFCFCFFHSTSFYFIDDYSTNHSHSLPSFSSYQSKPQRTVAFKESVPVGYDPVIKDTDSKEPSKAAIKRQRAKAKKADQAVQEAADKLAKLALSGMKP